LLFLVKGLDISCLFTKIAHDFYLTTNMVRFAAVHKANTQQAMFHASTSTETFAQR